MFNEDDRKTKETLYECPNILQAILVPPPPKVDRGYVFTPVCLGVSRISKNIVNKLRRNLVDRLGVLQALID